jgi:hypothetical protein
VSKRSQNCCVGIRYVVMDSKFMSGAARADGVREGVMLPSGTWWRTREPVVLSWDGYGEQYEGTGIPFSWWKRVKKMDLIARVGIEVSGHNTLLAWG